MRKLICASVIVMALAGFLPSSGAFAAGDESVKVRRADLSPDGSVNVVVSLSGTLTEGIIPASAFEVLEGGQRMELLSVEPLIESQLLLVAIALVIDVSGSTAGEPIDNAKAAARNFVAQLPDGVVVQLISFSSTAVANTEFTTDKGRVTAAIDALVASGETALYDGIVLASQSLSGLPDHQHNIVFFGDGRDTVSQNSMDAAIAAATSVQATVTSVGLTTPDLDQAVLDNIASATGGRSLPVALASDIHSAFAQVAKEIASQYVLTYKGTDSATKELIIEVKIATAIGVVSDQVVVVNPRESVEPPKPEKKEPKVIAAPEAPILAPVGLYVGTAAVFMTLLMVAWVISMTRKPRAVALLAKALTPATLVTNRGASTQSSLVSGVARRTIEAVDRLPKPKGFEEKLQLQLERASWPLRTSEFLVLQGLAGFGGVLIGGGLFGSITLALLLLIVCGYTPRVMLRRRVDKRESAFLAQLPETLQLIAGSLQAGYGLSQALDTVAKEAGPPGDGEFSRVLTETRLGMSFDDALDGMARRVGSEDFDWVVMAIKIQRQVGGNLAALLDSVAGTLRGRERLRRQVKVLSAEGRLSAWVLSVMPFLLAGYMAAVNPEYLGELFTTSTGLAMVFGGFAAMVIGVFWMRRITKIEV